MGEKEWSIQASSLYNEKDFGVRRAVRMRRRPEPLPLGERMFPVLPV